MESMQQERVVCQRCGKPILGIFTHYAICDCMLKMKPADHKKLRRKMYAQALINTIRTMRTTARLAAGSPDPRLAAVRR